MSEGKGSGGGGLGAVRAVGGLAYGAPRLAAFLLLVTVHVAKTMGKVPGPYAPFSGWAVLAFATWAVADGTVRAWRSARAWWEGFWYGEDA